MEDRVQDYIQITIQVPGSKQVLRHLPNDKATLESISHFLHQLEDASPQHTSWKETKPWEKLAKDRIAKHTKAGLALRGARFREDLSQKALADLVDISQENISRMENGSLGVYLRDWKAARAFSFATEWSTIGFG